MADLEQRDWSGTAARSTANEHAMPFVTVSQMREVDRLAVEAYGITLLQMMENAGRALAALARQRFLGGNAAGARVLVLAGSGGNGGGGLVAARRLHGWGADVEVRLSAPAERLRSETRHQLVTLERSGVQVHAGAEPVPSCDLVVDALIGYSLRGAPQGLARQMIDETNGAGRPVVSLDIPSGMDADTGVAAASVIHASATLTLALPKVGLRAHGARRWIGELYLADIGIPPELYESPSLGLLIAPVFALSDIVRIW